jgi:glycerol kinase
MNKDTGIPIQTLRVDGGAANNNYLMQFQADILGIPIERAANLETTAMGAAFLAGLATGFWNSTDELQSIVGIGKRFEPEMDAKERDFLYEGWQQAVAATQMYKHEPKNN